MALEVRLPGKLIGRRRFLQAGLAAAACAAVYSGEFERHWLQVREREVCLSSLHPAFDGMRIAQVSDIHLDNFTEPFFLRQVVERVNGLRPDAVFLTGDYVTAWHSPTSYGDRAMWQCAEILKQVECRAVYAVLGNHDALLGAKLTTEALTASGISVLQNSYVPIERAGARFWLSGLDDPLIGHPNPELAIPASIRNRDGEPVVLLCHCPDYVDKILFTPEGLAVDLMLSGHTHGGQIRLPGMRPLVLPALGSKYVKGWFRLGRLQLHVNCGVGTVGVPFRFHCPPEITLMTLRRDAGRFPQPR